MYFTFLHVRHDDIVLTRDPARSFEAPNSPAQKNHTATRVVVCTDQQLLCDHVINDETLCVDGFSATLAYRAEEQRQKWITW